ncbi:MAG: hypothetical protein ISR48_11630 [Alphaproteobacteria bacterium]|nr:hypothetical protein [Alphaproteobacteria bacterium]
MERVQTPAVFIGRLCLVLILSSGLPGCKTVGGEGPQTGTEPGATGTQGDSATAARSYTFFNDQGDHLKELVAAGKLEEAAGLYISEKPFFDEKREKYAADLKSLANSLNRTRTPALTTALGTLRGVPSSPSKESWAGAKSAMDGAGQALEEYDSIAMLAEPEFRAAEAGQLRALYEETTTRLRAA